MGSLFWQLYSQIEKTFFSSLSRKLGGNIGFLLLIQLASIYLLSSQTNTDNSTLSWLLVTVSLCSCIFSALSNCSPGESTTQRPE